MKLILVLVCIFLLIILFLRKSDEGYNKEPPVKVIWSKGWGLYIGTDPEIVDVSKVTYGKEDFKKNITSQLGSDFIWVSNDFNMNEQFEFLYQNLSKPITIVSSDGDTCIPDDIEPSIFKKLIDSPLIKEWYAQNRGHSENPKLKFLPIGADLHSTHEGTKDYEEAAKQIEEIRYAARDEDRKIKIFCDCHLSNSDARYGSDRSTIKNLDYDSIFYQEERIPRLEIWKRYTEFTFGVSPHGNGLDCHRTWEMLYLGMIVIVKTSSLDQMYKDLPVVIVKDWSELESPENLKKWKEMYSGKTSKDYIWDKLQYSSYL
jgi:hypothetical protein